MLGRVTDFGESHYLWRESVTWRDSLILARYNTVFNCCTQLYADNPGLDEAKHAKT